MEAGSIAFRFERGNPRRGEFLGGCGKIRATEHRRKKKREPEAPAKAFG